MSKVNEYRHESGKECASFPFVSAKTVCSRQKEDVSTALDKVQALNDVRLAAIDEKWNVGIESGPFFAARMVLIDEKDDIVFSHSMGVTNVAKRDVEYIAMLHNMAPELIDAVRLLGKAASVMSMNEGSNIEINEIRSEIMAFFGNFGAEEDRSSVISRHVPL